MDNQSDNERDNQLMAAILIFVSNDICLHPEAEKEVVRLGQKDPVFAQLFCKEARLFCSKRKQRLADKF